MVAWSLEVSLEEFFKASVVNTNWNMDRKDENLIRFGLMWKVYDMVALKGLHPKLLLTSQLLDVVLFILSLPSTEFKRRPAAPGYMIEQVYFLIGKKELPAGRLSVRTKRWLFFLSSSLISWKSMKEETVSKSSTVCWMKRKRKSVYRPIKDFYLRNPLEGALSGLVHSLAHSLLVLWGPEAQGDFTRWCQLSGLWTFVAMHGIFGLIGLLLRQFELARSVQL
ncbi:hypothetical protein BUALT_Bualt14G0010400 [Buddleja alternifolia]|uniref:Uncharacterized protein n=1 Tax=Buddleja alternifolia TaxID=168488 RepID=A0AAV6WN18_9LAMI|nr:hypothetical protein BUALT_Bualt14G0010400 [Buddleja alternifolia]